MKSKYEKNYNEHMNFYYIAENKNGKILNNRNNKNQIWIQNDRRADGQVIFKKQH